MARIADIASFVGTCVAAVLYGAAYGCVGFYIWLGLYSAGVDEPWLTVWLLAWVTAGSILLTVWTIRWTGIDVRRRPRSRPLRQRDPQRHPSTTLTPAWNRTRP